VGIAVIAQLNNLRLTIKLPVFILGATFFVALAIGVDSFLKDVAAA